MFAEMNSMRQAGMTLNALGPADIHAYLDISGTPRWAWSHFFRAIRTLDQAWLSLMDQRRSKKRKKGGS